MSGMTEKQKDELAALGERMATHRRRLEVVLSDEADEDMETSEAVINTLVLFIDHGKVPEALENAIAHQINAVDRKRRVAPKRAVVFRTCPKGLAGVWWQFVAEGAPRIAAGGLYPCGTKDCRGPIFSTHEAASDAARSEGYGEVRVSDSEAVLP